MSEFDTWNSIKNTAEWHAFVDAKAESYKFRCGNFFNYILEENYKQLGIFFNHVMPDVPTDRSPVKCPLGSLQRRSLVMDPPLLYTAPEGIARQGDLIELVSDINLFPVPTKYAVIASHTCDIQNKPFATLFPAYRKEDFNKFENDAEKAKTLYTNVRNNQVIYFLPYLPFDPLLSETLAVDFRQMATVTSRVAQSSKRILSLSLQGIFYFQNRSAISQIRDLKDRDDLRIKC